MSSNDTPSEPSQTQAEGDNSFVCLPPRLTDFQCSIMQVTGIELLIICAAAHYVNGIGLVGETQGSYVT